MIVKMLASLAATFNTYVNKKIVMKLCLWK